MLRAFKYRLYPTKKQAELLDKHINCCRLVYNLALDVKSYAWSTQRKHLSKYDLMLQLTEMKKEFSWLMEVDSQCLQQAIQNMDKAYQKFFSGLAKYPTFKKKGRGAHSFKNPHGRYVRVIGGKIRFPKFTEGISFVEHVRAVGKIKNSIVSRTTTGKYFISIMCDTGIAQPEKQPIKNPIGIDLGLKHFAITSEGEKIESPKFLKRAQAKLAYLQRQSSKKKRGSNNKKKAHRLVAIQHEKVANQRRYFTHELSTRLINNHDTLCFEDLNINGMVQNRSLSSAISDTGWGMFVKFCKYKADWYGKTVLQMPMFEPSTKKCSNCESIVETLKLADREWICPTCGVLHDRDINAAVNIKNYCITNCGGAHRGKPVELPTLVGAEKQEVN